MELNFTSSNLTNSNTSLLSRFNSLVTAQVASLQPPELEKELAIMFLDIRNFTGLMESRPAREVVQVVKRLFSMFGQIVKSFGGTVVETAGDSLYAVFGMGGAIKEAVNESYQAAKMIFDTIDLFNAAHGNENRGELLEIGIGLHKGEVVIGQSSLDGQSKLSVMGFPVNIASRLQTKTKELNNDLLVSEEAYQLLDGRVPLPERRCISLAGVSSTQEVRLLGKPYYTRGAQREDETYLDYIIAFSG